MKKEIRRIIRINIGNNKTLKLEIGKKIWTHIYSKLVNVSNHIFLVSYSKIFMAMMSFRSFFVILGRLTSGEK